MALCQDRLVVNKKGKGWVVSELSLRDIIETYEVRKLIEMHAGKQGCLDCPKEVLEEMEVTLEELETISEIEPFREKNRRFHELIVLSSGNAKFHEVFLWSMRNIRWCGYITMEIPGRMEEIRKEHKAILKGFLKRDPDSIGKALENHISTLQNTIAQKWDEHGF
jgi:DNA-binding GntR family transcriptional regulator